MNSTYDDLGGAVSIKKYLGGNDLVIVKDFTGLLRQDGALFKNNGSFTIMLILLIYNVILYFIFRIYL